MNKHVKIIIIQTILLAVVAAVLYLLYPKINIDIDGTLANFNSINANVVIISENPDFSNPKFIDLEKDKNISLDLKPGIYYWKSSNSLIKGLKHEFTIKSEVGMEIERERENESELINVGNVKINVTKSEEGILIGHIILEPNESEKIEDKPEEKYAGRQI